MPNSDHKLKRNQIILRALKKVGNHMPTDNDVASAIDVLNDLIKEIDVDGNWLWANSLTETQLNLTSGNRHYSYNSAGPPTYIPGDILDIPENGMWLLKGTNYVPIARISHSEAISTYDREGTGEPTAFYLEKQPNLQSNRIHFFPTPNGSYTAKFTYRRRLYDFDSATDNPDFPQEWNLCLVDKLASELSDEYGLPLNERVLLQQRADGRLKKMLGQVPESITPFPVPGIYY